MKLTLKELTKSNIKFSLNSDVSFANSIRRILLGEVPSIAIDVVEIRENRTVLPDEMIANRLGLLPIRYSGTLMPKQECSCDGFCEQCSIRLTLKKSNDSDAVLSVSGQDLQTTVQGVSCSNTLILKLAPGQKVDMACIATVGTPQTHAKFCPVTVVGFTYDPRNKTRETKLWRENDVKKEWPGINQSDEIEWGDIEDVEMNVEVVEGMGRPKEVFLKALKIYKAKMEAILDAIQ